MGPYYAMFPSAFALEVVCDHSNAGDAVLDPFAGRATSIYAATALQRSGLGIEINPVGWLYGHVKLHPASEKRLLSRIEEIASVSASIDACTLTALPKFFSVCYTPAVLRYLLASRRELRWRTSVVDATLMAIILVHLHGKKEQSLSNQMRQGKAMSPGYSLRWWKERGMEPPDIDPEKFLRARVAWRYAKGIPQLTRGRILLGDSLTVLPRLARKVEQGAVKPFDLLLTSPPYHAVTNYNYDQWLRLWMLGGPAQPVRSRGPWESKFDSKAAYRALLNGVFVSCARIMKKTATIYVRTDARPFTHDVTVDALRFAFPEKKVSCIPRPFTRSTQTALFGDKTQKPGEVDIVLHQ
jgi:hypothetical protein